MNKIIFILCYFHSEKNLKLIITNYMGCQIANILIKPFEIPPLTGKFLKLIYAKRDNPRPYRHNTNYTTKLDYSFKVY